MTQGVRGSALLDTGFVQGLLEGVLQNLGADVPLLLGKQPGAAVTKVLVVVTQQLEYMIRKRDGTIFPSFAAAHPELVAVTVDVLYGQPHRLGDSQPTGVHGRERHAENRMLYPLENCSHLLPRQNHRQLFRAPWSYQVKYRP